MTDEARSGDPMLRALANVVEHRVEALAAQDRWTSADDADLDQRFEESTRAALRSAALHERSAVIQRVGRALVPARLRPAIKARLARAAKRR